MINQIFNKIDWGYDDTLIEECKNHVINSLNFNVSHSDIVEELICDFELDRVTANKLFFILFRSN